MKETKNVPRLRFPGFTDDWEQRKLGELVSFSKGSGYSKGDLKDVGTPIILYGRLYTKYETVISEVDTFVDEKKGSVYSNGGEVIVPASGETAEDISIASVVDKPGVLLGGDLNVITPPDDLDSAFLAISISNGKPHNVMAKMAQGKSVVHLHNSDLAKIDLPYPSHDEQCKISGLFSDIDKLIILHQRKLDTIKQYKQGMLQKMFPKEGEKVPEIRFPGFTTKWDSVCLGDLYKERNERGNDTLPILSVSIHTGVSGGELDTEELGKNVRRSEDKSLYKRVYSGDLVFNMMRAWQGAIGVVKNEGMVSPAYISAVPNERVYPPFMDYLLRRTEVINQINNLSYGVTDFRKRLYWDSFVQLETSLPSLKEQVMMTDLFRKIDILLTTNQKKVNQMLKYKQGLLQQMFV